MGFVHVLLDKLLFHSKHLRSYSFVILREKIIHSCLLRKLNPIGWKGLLHEEDVLGAKGWRGTPPPVLIRALFLNLS
jgi:hypothetical protein